jgi:hypothetical protein
LDRADEIELVDLPAEELLKRLAEGKVYTPERSAAAVQNFFRKGNLTALREIALRKTAERVGMGLQEYMQANRIEGRGKRSSVSWWRLVRVPIPNNSFAGRGAWPQTWKRRGSPSMCKLRLA